MHYQITMTILQTMKANLNPKNLDASYGPQVIAYQGLGLPRVSSMALIDFDSSIKIIGSSSIAPQTVVRRKTKIVSGFLGRGSVLQDYVSLQFSSIVEENVVIAHGSKVGVHSIVGENGHMNIKAALGDNCKLLPAGYIGPNCSISSLDAEQQRIVPGNMLIFGDDKSGHFALSNAKLDRNFHITDGNRRKLHYEAGDDLTDVSALATMQRDDLEPFPTLTETRPDTRLKNPFFADVIESHLDTSPTKPGEYKRLTFFNWLTNYPDLQRSKQLNFLSEEIELYGMRVWHDVQIKSAILTLSRTSIILHAMGENSIAKDMENLGKACSYLIGAYTPENESEEKVLADTMEYFHPIIGEAIPKFINMPESIKFSCRVNEDAANVFTNTHDDKRENYEITRQFGYQLASYRLSEVRGLIDSLVNNYSTTLPKSHSTKINAHVKAAQLKTKLRGNSKYAEVDLTGVEDGTKVLAYKGFVPIIDEDAVLLGCFFRGIVRIGNSTCVQSSITNEQNNRAQLNIGDNNYISHAIIHTASREQWGVDIVSTLMDGDAGKEVFCHGSKIGIAGQLSYVGSGCVIGDGEEFCGFAIPNTLGPGQHRLSKKWMYLAGNNLHPELSPEQACNQPGFMGYWQSSPYQSIQPTNIDAVQEKISEIKSRKSATAEQTLQKNIEKYGVIFKYSPHLQAISRSLYYAGKILEATGDEKQAIQLTGLSEGLEYLLGMRKEISAQAAAALDSFETIIKQPIERLNTLAQEGNNIDISGILPVLKAKGNPLFADDQPAHIKASMRPPGFDFMKPKERLGSILTIQPENITRMTFQIAKLPKLMARICKELEAHISADQKPRHQI